MLNHKREKYENDLLKNKSNYEKIIQYYVLYIFFEQSLTKSLIITNNISIICDIFESLFNA